jgi:hypothetical protein
MTDNRHTQQQIDRLLMEQGEYHPLEFLLQEGRLSYGDYEAWRNGEIRDLSEMLFGDPEQILKALQQAAVYLQRLGWESERLVYRERGGPEASPLRFSQESRLDECFHRAYRKPREQSQLDLFTDTSTTYLVNGITQALQTLNAGDARQALNRLYETAPDHIHLGELERLVEPLEQLEHPVRDLPAEMERLQGEITLLAERHLNKTSQQLLIPLWRRLTGALLETPFDPARPEHHASHTAAQARDWGGVRQAVEGEAQWQQQPALLERHAWACTQLSDQPAALQSWCWLCWQFPQRDGHLENCNDPVLRRGWQAFLDLEPELPTETFPAWLLLWAPGLAQIAPDGDRDPLCPDSYRTLLHLQRSGSEMTNEQSLAWRAKLKQQAPLLFHHFLATRATG